MKRIFFTAVIMLLAFGLYAQDKNIKAGLVAGMNVSKYDLSGIDSRIGFHVGVKAEIPLSSLQSGMFVDIASLISLKGAKWDSGAGDVKFNPYYLEIPVQLGYKYSLGQDLSVFGKFGPYFGLGLCGKIKAGDEKTDCFDDDAMKRFDMGLGLHAGFEVLDRYQCSIGYDWGLTDVNDGHIDEDVKTRNLSISFGYLF